MKLIVENWRSWLGGGAPIHPKIKKILEAIVEQTNVSIAIKKKVESVEFSYVDTDTLELSYLPHGIVEMGLDSGYSGACLQGYVVSWAKASSGWGPLLYEVAIEWASKNASGLAADRHSVSSDAETVWTKYAQRPDIDSKQLDIDLDKSAEGQLGKGFKFAIDQGYISQLTPEDPTDDCVQISTLQQAGTEDWENSPLSQLYYKSSQEVTDALRKAGRLVEV